MKRRQLTGYAPWQLWDFVFDRGIALLLIGSLMGASVLWPGYIALSGQTPPEEVPLKLLAIATAQMISVFAVVAASGIVANDRTGGYYRFLFSKPVRMPAYYALQFFVTLAGALLVTLILLAAFWLLVGWVTPRGPLVMMVVTFVALGGPIFFFSTFTRFDWAMLVVLWGGSALARAIYGSRDWYQAARWVLPPTHHIDKLRDALFAGTQVDAAGVAWLAGYGLAFFLAGLVVLHRKAIAE